VGSDESWDKAEKALAQALDSVGVAWEELKGEGAFYGPKIEYSLKDSLGRVWQCGTIQVDFNMPVRLGAEFVDADNTRKPPVMLHRAIVGSLERFIGILIENFAGAMPVWLSPVQVVVASITDAQADYAESVAKTLQSRGFRAQADLRSEKISLKIRELSLQKVPYILVVGDKEKASGQVTVRARGGVDLGAMAADAFCQKLDQEISARQ
jgi:threonyl-tRNA synthetase